MSLYGTERLARLRIAEVQRSRRSSALPGSRPAAAAPSDLWAADLLTELDPGTLELTTPAESWVGAGEVRNSG